MTLHRAMLTDWLQNSHLGQHTQQQETLFFQGYLSHFAPKRLLQIGCLKPIAFRQPENGLYLIQNTHLPADVLSLSTQTPWLDQTFDCIILAHELDCVAESYVLLHEMWRILQAHGTLMLTGFNPYSLWRLGKWANVPCVADSLPLSTLKATLQKMGWQIEQGRFMNYLPPLQHEKWLKYCQFMELVGNRWYPHGAAVYGLVLRKTVLGTMPFDGVMECEMLDAAHLAYARNRAD